MIDYRKVEPKSWHAWLSQNTSKHLVAGYTITLVPPVPVVRNERREAGARQLAVQEEVSVITQVQYESFTVAELFHVTKIDHNLAQTSPN